MPIMMYVKFMDNLRNSQSQSQIIESERMWKQEAARCRGRNKMPSQPQAETINE
jgi:hypothetical protein